MDRKFNKVFLVGYMGSGKTYLGEILADRLNFLFKDTDILIEKMSKKSVHQIFSQYGENHFRKLETETIKSLSNDNSLIISTGGGLPCFNNNMDWMKKNGVVIFLNVEQKLLITRLIKELAIRPILSNIKNESELEAFVSAHISSRLPFYESAHLAIDIMDDNLKFLDRLVSYLKLVLN